MRDSKRGVHCDAVSGGVRFSNASIMIYVRGSIAPWYTGVRINVQEFEARAQDGRQVHASMRAQRYRVLQRTLRGSEGAGETTSTFCSAAIFRVWLKVLGKNFMMVK